MITPRRTRLVRVPDLHAFRHAILDHVVQGAEAARTKPRTGDPGPRATAMPGPPPRVLCATGWSGGADGAKPPGLVIVPTRGAARQLTRLLAAVECRGREDVEVVTRDELYDRLYARLAQPPRQLTALEREAIMQRAAREAAVIVPDLSFRLRPGLVAEMIRFYDDLRRHLQQVDRFEELIDDSLAGDDVDRGARRLRNQTTFLAAAFRRYEQAVRESNAWDEHLLRDRLLADAAADPVRRIIVTVPDWIADPDGLHLADFDLLARIPGLAAIDLLATDRILASGFHERIHDWFPGIESVEDAARECSKPVLAAPPAAPPDEPWWTVRDREEELVLIVRQIDIDQRGGVDIPLDRRAIVFKTPLPYLYLAGEVLPAAGVPYQAYDALPLGVEPIAAALDLVLDAVSSRFARAPLVALLGSPHLLFADGGGEISRESISVLNMALSQRHYLGELNRLQELATDWRPGHAAALPAVQAALAAAHELAPLVDARPASAQVECLQAFWRAHLRPLPEESGAERSAGDQSRGLDFAANPVLPWGSAPQPGSHHPTAHSPCRGGPGVGRGGPSAPLRSIPPHDAQTASWEPRLPGARCAPKHEQRARAAIAHTLSSLAAAHAVHDDPLWTIDDLALAVRRAIEDQTFERDEPSRAGVQLVDDQAARYGDFDEVAVVGLVEPDWPERPRRNIFYPPALLRSLGWPSEKDRRAAADARFLELLASASRQTVVSTFTLEDDALVSRSSLLDEIPRARLSTVVREPTGNARVFLDEALSLEPPILDHLEGPARAWADLRMSRSPAEAPQFHGWTLPAPPAPVFTVSALETYLECPFKFFARHVLKLQDEPEDQEVMDPKRQGQFVHHVFERFFKTWQADGRGAITPQNLDHARELFTAIVDSALDELPPAEAGLERTRLVGSPAASGLGEAVLRMEAERPVAVVERLLEHDLRGEFSFVTRDGVRMIPLRGKADRIDLLADGTFRVIDYKLGWPPNRARALQLPIYTVCAEQRLDGHRGREWRLGEAVYLAFKGPRRVVPLSSSAADRAKALTDAQQRLADTVDAVSRGEFPPTPDDVWRCETCSFSSVCRKDYVGDV
jgi:RecB family exonuclease